MIWQNIKKLNNNRENYKINAIQLNNDIILTDQEEIVENFAQYFSTIGLKTSKPDSTFKDYKAHMETYKIDFDNSAGNDPYNQPFTLEEIEEYLNQIPRARIRYTTLCSST